MPIENLTIIGCGGQGKVVLDAFLATKKEYAITLKDSNSLLWGKTMLGYIIEKLAEPEQFTGCVHVAIGNNRARAQIHEANIHADFLTIIHPAALISPFASIDKGTFIAAKAILAPACVVGEGCIINHGAIVDHDVRVGDFSHIAPNATLGGNVSIGTGVLIGAGATILPGVTIGDYAIIGAGSVVCRDVMKNSKMKGVPAR